MLHLKILKALFFRVRRHYFRFLSDKLYCKLQYYVAHGHFPNLKTPRTFNEKIQWYKLYYRNPVITQLADKYGVRAYVEKKGLGHILNDLYGVYDSVDQIDFDTLPNQFVLKATHGCKMNIICKEKKGLDWQKSLSQMKKWLKENCYYTGREWVYKNIPPRIVCEKYLENEEHGELIDYKFYCYNGKPEVLFICAGRFSNEGVKYDAFDMSWNRIPAYKGKPATSLNFKRPSNFDEMLDIVRDLCQGFPFIRVDLYLVKSKIILGELTFYPDNGTVPFTPDKYNAFFGDFFTLPPRIC